MLSGENPSPDRSLTKARLVVLISGFGSNLQAILDACAGGELPAQIVAVVSNKPEAYGLERARLANVPAIAFPKPKEEDRRLYDARLAQLVASFRPDWIVLAGWMRILSSAFLDCFRRHVINLHPALPGAFPGTNAIARAFEAYQKKEINQTGVMVHLVPDEGVDNGPVLGQVEIRIEEADTLESLEQRVHTAEHRLLVNTLNRLISGESPLKDCPKRTDETDLTGTNGGGEVQPPLPALLKSVSSVLLGQSLSGD